MKKLEFFLIPIITFFVITDVSVGQSSFNLANGCKVNITSGTSIQQINLNIGSGSQLINRGNLTVNGILANFVGTYGLILKADENGFGSLMHYTNNVPATVEQYLSSERWHLVTPPVQNVTIGVFENIYLKEWSEPASAWTYLITPLSIPMELSKGYSAWAGDELTGSTTVVFEGSLRAGNVAYIDLDYTGASAQQGWNLVGNPYPSPVEWNTNWILNNVGGWAIVYENGTFKGWNPWMPPGEQSFNGKSDGFIAPTQGFWVRTTGAYPYMMVPQSARSHYPADFLKDTGISDNESLHITVSANGFSDETVILFLENATSGFDGLYDLEKHYNVAESPNIFTIPFDGEAYAIDVLPENWIETTSPAIIPLGFEIGQESECTLTAELISDQDGLISVYLEDLKVNYTQNLTTNKTYVFTATEEDDLNRFLLHFGQSQYIPKNLTGDISIYAWQKEVFIKTTTGFTGKTRIADASGRLIKKAELFGGLNRIPINDGGVYIVVVISSGRTLSGKVFINY